MTLEERQLCLQEALRVVKQGGIIFAGGINRFGYLRDLLLGVAGNPSEVVNVSMQL